MIPLALLAPIFIAAAAAVVVPLLVHLVHKEKKDAVAFPSLMFIRRTPYPFSARQRIRDWLLFLARCAIVALAALAFARPVFARRGAAAGDSRRGTEIVLLVDRSFSMKYGDRWSRAQVEARRVIDAIDPADRLTVIPFDRHATAVNEPSGDKAQLRAAFDSIAPGDEGTRLAPAVTLAGRVLSSSELPRLRLVVVSDFQRTSWDLTDEITVPPGTEVKPIDVSGPVVDRSVRGVDVRRDPDGDVNRVNVTARLARLGPAERAVRARLEVGGREVARGTADLPGDGGATVSFGSVAVPNRPVPARVVIDSDDLAGDDEFHFMLSRPPTVPVLVVDHRDSPPERNIFLTRALEIGDAPGFDLLVRRSDQVTPADLAGRRVLILNDAGFPAGLGAARVEAFVRAGGGMLTVLGERTSAREWPAAARALMPGQIATPSDRLGERGAVLGVIDRGHQALSVFSGARSGDLSSARFFRYRAIDTTDGVLARFDDGAPALVEHHLGSGRVLTWGSSFDGYWNDLARQPVFLPFVHQLVRYAAAYRDRKRAYAVGEAVRPEDLEGSSTAGASRWSVISPRGTRLAVGGKDAPAALELREAGVYQIRPSGTPNAEPRLLAVNVAPAELDFATFDVLRLTNALAPATQPASSQVADPMLQLQEREQRQSLWWYILAVVAVIFLVEGIVARRASTNRLEPV
ncbi:MAG: BatA and WFA domain-containing protein [Gemmatimonadaceae bacterium]|nr:BatA and WFA domain-containing protein [Gemmatimonadaceae bacterium]